MTSEGNFIQALMIFEGLRVENLKLISELEAARKRIQELEDKIASAPKEAHEDAR